MKPSARWEIADGNNGAFYDRRRAPAARAGARLASRTLPELRSNCGREEEEKLALSRMGGERSRLTPSMRARGLPSNRTLVRDGDECVVLTKRTVRAPLGASHTEVSRQHRRA